jgi:hypothetical protein
MVTDVTPFGSTLATLDYNLRHAIEKRDEARMAACLTEMFRHFVLMNRPMTRLASSQLDRHTLLELRMTIGPFSNPVSFGMHQRLLVTLMGIAVRQLGIASPTMTSHVLQEWKRYERVLFHRPALALARLLGIGTTLCHCKKDASVSYARHVFEDTSKMREWRKDVLTNPEILSTYIPNADQAHRARKMLLCNKVYFNNRLRLRRYQGVSIATPHPEYMCQGGSMHRSNVLKLVDAIRQGIPRTAGPLALSIVQDVEDVMIYLASHLNNMYDRDAFDALQVDYQIFLYLFQRILSEESGGGTLLRSSERIVLSAANHVTEQYALQLWVSRPNMVDLIKYGVRGEPLSKSGRGKKRALVLNDLIDAFQPEMIPRIHEQSPPSILRDHDNVPRECENSEIQRHPAVQSFRFLFGLYRLHHMWTKCTSTKLLAAQGSGAAGERERVLVDREFVDLTRPHRVLYQCSSTGVAAAEVHLQGSAAAELFRTTDVAPRDDFRVEHIETSDVGEAEVFTDHLCRPDETGGPKSLKAVVIGPFPMQDLRRLEEEVAHYDQLKHLVHVQPDVVYVKKMMYLDFASVTGTSLEGQILGRTYAWVVYVPSLRLDDTHVVMTIDELKSMAKQDATLAAMARSILRPMNLMRSIAVMKRTCGEYSPWKIGDNYVSFHVRARGSEVVVEDIRVHTITETLLGSCPDYRRTMPSDSRTTAQVIQSLIAKCSENGKYAAANIELANCEALLNQVM